MFTVEFYVKYCSHFILFYSILYCKKACEKNEAVTGRFVTTWRDVNDVDVDVINVTRVVTGDVKTRT